MKKYLLIIVILLGTVFLVHSQDSHLSQYFASPMIVNPASTGMFDGYHRVHAQYRSQWNSVVQKNPFLTFNGAYDQPYRRFGFGAYIMNNRAGRGGFNVLNFLLSAAYEITNDPKQIHHLSTGIQIGGMQKSVDVGKLTFDQQYSKGNGFDPGINNGESFNRESVLIPSLNFGIHYFKRKRGGFLNPHGGIAVFNITEPKESFLGEVSNLPRRYVAHGGALIKAGKDLHVEPILLFMKQANLNEFTPGVMGYYDIEGTNSSIILGSSYRSDDAVVIHTGMHFGEYTFRFSYDINTSSLREVSGGKGAFEFTISYKKLKNTYVPSII